MPSKFITPKRGFPVLSSGQGGLLGLRELTKVFEDIEQIGTQLTGHRAAANLLYKRVVAEAPQGPTGNLKRGVISGTYKQAVGKPFASFVAMSHSMASHALNVELGTRQGQAPNPYFRRAVTGEAPKAMELVKANIGQALDRAMK